MPVNFFNLFGKSPLKPLYEHIKKVHQCCQELPLFFDAVFAQDWDKATIEQEKIGSLEREADNMKRDIRINLPNSLFMPVQRTDLLELLSQQDEIANRAKDVSGIIIGRKLVIPKEVEELFKHYIRRSLDSSELAAKAIHELDDLVETGFRGKEINIIQSMVKDLDYIEHDTDKIQIQLRHELYLIEKGLNPIDAIFIYNVLDMIGDISDQAERVGSRLELMIARS